MTNLAPEVPCLVAPKQKQQAAYMENWLQPKSDALLRVLN